MKALGVTYTRPVHVYNVTANLSAETRTQMGIEARHTMEREFEKSKVVQHTIHAVFD